MSHLTSLVINKLDEVFNNMAVELKCPVELIQVVISFPNGGHRYDIYKDFEEVKTGISLDDYGSTAIDWSGSLILIDATLAQSGGKLAKECEADINDIKVVLKHREGDIPDAVLLCKNRRVRRIDINKEYISSAAA